MSAGREIRSWKDDKGHGSHLESKQLIEDTREEGTRSWDTRGRGLPVSLQEGDGVRVAGEAEREAETRSWRPLLVSGLGSHQKRLRGKAVWSVLHELCIGLAGQGPERERYWGTGPAIHAQGEEVRSNSHAGLFFYNSLGLICL